MSTISRRVPIRYFLMLRDALHRSGVDTGRLLLLAGIDVGLFNARDSMLSEMEIDRFVSAARKITGRDDLGFDLGQCIKMNSHDLLGYGLMSCTTLHEFMGMAARHYHLMAETWSMTYRRHFSGGEIIYTPCTAQSPDTLRFFLEAQAIAHQNQVHLLLGSQVTAYDIYLSMPQPEHIRRYLALAPVRFHFHEGALPGLRVVMGANLLDLPLALGDPQVVRQIDARCSALGQRLPRADVGWGEYVTMVLREARGEQVTLEDLAKRVNVSARTIDRHLKKEGLGYRELSDKVRFEHACQMLCVKNAGITDVALHLGFSDTANFSRAFKRVVGVSPSEYQRNAASP